MSLITKAINVGVLLLGASPAIRIALANTGNVDEMTRQLQLAYTGVGRDGSFDASRLAEGYAPLVAAIALKKGIKFLRKTARV